MKERIVLATNKFKQNATIALPIDNAPRETNLSLKKLLDAGKLTPSDEWYQHTLQQEGLNQRAIDDPIMQADVK